MDKTIDVVDFLKKYNAFASEKLKENYFNDTIKTVDFVNFEELEFLSNSIIEHSCIDENGMFKIDSCKKYILYIYTIIDSFTNLEIHADKWIGEYNALDRYGLIEKIINYIPEKVMTTFSTILKMKTEEVMFNMNNIPNFFMGLAKNLNPFILNIIDEIIKETEKKNGDDNVRDVF